MSPAPSPLPPQGTRLQRLLAASVYLVIAYAIGLVLVALVVAWVASH